MTYRFKAGIISVILIPIIFLIIAKIIMYDFFFQLRNLNELIFPGQALYSFMCGWGGCYGFSKIMIIIASDILYLVVYFLIGYVFSWLFKSIFISKNKTFRLKSFIAVIIAIILITLFTGKDKVEFGFTTPIKGTAINSYSHANSICQNTFGENWIWSEFHVSDGLTNKGKLITPEKYDVAWAGISDQYWHCFDAGKSLEESSVSSVNYADAYNGGKTVKLNYKKDSITVSWWPKSIEGKYGGNMYENCNNELPLLCTNFETMPKNMQSKYQKWKRKE